MKKIDNIKVIRINKDNYKTYKDSFIKIYKEIFSQAPYYEIFEDCEVEETYKLSLYDTNILLLAIINNEVIGFALGIQLSTYHDEDFKSLASKYFTLDEVFYNTELGVLPKYRGFGIGSKLIKERIEFAEKRGYKIICMRTIKEGSMSMPLYKKLGFKLLEGSEHTVNTKKNKPNIKDIRVLLYKEITNQ